MTELWERSAVELAAMIRTRAASSREVVEAHLARVEEVNGAVNAVTRLLEDTALPAADVADAEVAAGAELGPFHGVPFTVKESIDCVGSPTTQGIPALAGLMPPMDAPTVERMRRAGAIPFARTNLPEFALRIVTDNPLHGLTTNPWDPSLTAGGSSGGEAAALAVGMSPIGLGTDLGGSLRAPAYCCGVASLKATRGRIPSASSVTPGDPPLAMQLMAVSGPMARTIDDVAIALQVLAGRDRRDPSSVDVPLAGARVPRTAALVHEMPGQPVAEDAVAAVEFAGGALADSGWVVDRVSPPELAAVHDIWAPILAADLSEALPMLTQLTSEPGARWIVQVCTDHHPGSPGDISGLHSERHRLERLWTQFFGQHSIVVAPTWPDRPFAHDADLGPEQGMSANLDRIRFATPANTLGFPAVAVPTQIRSGLPGGVQIYADHWREDIALDAARVVERATGSITPIWPAE